MTCPKCKSELHVIQHPGEIDWGCYRCPCGCLFWSTERTNRIESVTDFPLRIAPPVCENKRSRRRGEEIQKKLTNSDVIRIKKSIRSGMSGADLARMFGVTESVISRIRHGKLWAHLDG